MLKHALRRPILQSTPPRLADEPDDDVDDDNDEFDEEDEEDDDGEDEEDDEPEDEDEEEWQVGTRRFGTRVAGPIDFAPRSS